MCCHWTMCQIIIGQCVQLSLDNVSNNHVNVRQDFFALAIICPIFFHLNLILSNQMWFVRHRRCQRCQLSAPLPTALCSMMFVWCTAIFLHFLPLMDSNGKTTKPSSMIAFEILFWQSDRQQNTTLRERYIRTKLYEMNHKAKFRNPPNNPSGRMPYGMIIY